jgi:hypothetical protein
MSKSSKFPDIVVNAFTLENVCVHRIIDNKVLRERMCVCGAVTSWWGAQCSSQRKMDVRWHNVDGGMCALPNWLQCIPHRNYGNAASPHVRKTDVCTGTKSFTCPILHNMNPTHKKKSTKLKSICNKVLSDDIKDAFLSLYFFFIPPTLC